MNSQIECEEVYTTNRAEAFEPIGEIRACRACGDFRMDKGNGPFCPACRKKLEAIGRGKSAFPALDRLEEACLGTYRE